MPTGDGHITAPPAVAGALEVNSTRERRAIVAMRVNRPSTFRAFEREKIWILQGITNEGAQVDRRFCYPKGQASDIVCHIQPEWDEIESVDVFPFIEPAVDFISMSEEANGVKPKRIVETKGFGFNFCKTVARNTHEYRFF